MYSQEAQAMGPQKHAVVFSSDSPAVRLNETLIEVDRSTRLNWLTGCQITAHTKSRMSEFTICTSVESEDHRKIVAGPMVSADMLDEELI